MASSFGPNTLTGLAVKIGASLPVKVRFGWGWLGTGDGLLSMAGDHFRISGHAAGKPVDIQVPRSAVKAASLKHQRRVLMRIDRGIGPSSSLTWVDTDSKAADRLLAWLPDAVTQDPSIIGRWYEHQLGHYRRHAWLTYTLALLLTGVFIWQAVTAGNWSSIPIPQLIEQGGNLGPLTLDGEPWRLLTAALLHAGIDHLIGNLIALLIVAPYLERVFGRGGLLGLFVATAIFGSLVDLWLNFRIVCVGASGSIFALYGAVFAYALRRRGQLPMRSIYTILLSASAYMIWQIKAGFDSAGTNNAVHVTGAVSGFLLGTLIAPPLQVAWRETRQLGWGVLLAGLAVSASVAALPQARQSDNWKFVVMVETLDERYEAVRQRCVASLQAAQQANQPVDTAYGNTCLAQIAVLADEVRTFKPGDADLMERQVVIATNLKSYQDIFAQSGMKLGSVSQLVEIESAQQRIAADCQRTLEQLGQVDNQIVLESLKLQCIAPLLTLEQRLASLAITDEKLGDVASQLRQLMLTRREGTEAMAKALATGDVEAFNRAYEQVQAATARIEAG